MKHGTRTELYLGVDFPEMGTIAIPVKINTYALSEKGEQVCFDFDRDDISLYLHGHKTIISTLGFMLLLLTAVADLILLIIFIGYIHDILDPSFEGNKSKSV